MSWHPLTAHSLSRLAYLHDRKDTPRAQMLSRPCMTVTSACHAPDPSSQLFKHRQRLAQIILHGQLSPCCLKRIPVRHPMPCQDNGASVMAVQSQSNSNVLCIAYVGTSTRRHMLNFSLHQRPSRACKSDWTSGPASPTWLSTRRAMCMPISLPRMSTQSPGVSSLPRRSSSPQLSTPSPSMSGRYGHTLDL